MGLVVQLFYKESYSFVDEKTGQVVQGGKVQVADPNSKVSANGKVGSPAFYLKASYEALAQIPDDKIPGRYELQTVRVPRKDKSGQDVIEERVTSAKLL